MFRNVSMMIFGSYTVEMFVFPDMTEREIIQYAKERFNTKDPSFVGDLEDVKYNDDDIKVIRYEDTAYVTFDITGNYRTTIDIASISYDDIIDEAFQNLDAGSIEDARYLDYACYIGEPYLTKDEMPEEKEEAWILISSEGTDAINVKRFDSYEKAYLEMTQRYDAWFQPGDDHMFTNNVAQVFNEKTGWQNKWRIVSLEELIRNI